MIPGLCLPPPQPASLILSQGTFQTGPAQLKRATIRPLLPVRGFKHFSTEIKAHFVTKRYHLRLYQLLNQKQLQDEGTEMIGDKFWKLIAMIKPDQN